MLCIPKSNHKKLIDECYPPPKQLAGIAPEYKANSNELSRLAYYGNRKPAKLTKVGDVLVTKAQQASKGVGGSGQAADKAKASLMVTLAIIKELLTECHRDVNYFASQAATVISTALQAAARGGAHGSRDIDITARSAAAFYALASHLTTSSASTDATAGKQYTTLLSHFGRIAQEEVADADTRNRVRLLGVGALAGAVGSDLFFSPSSLEQISYIAPALIANFDNDTYEAEAGLPEEAQKIADKGSPSNAEYAAKRRPANARKVPAFSVDPEKSPSSLDVASAAMGSVYTALQNGDATHVQGFVASLLDYCNGKTGAARQWPNRTWCSWIAENLVAWTALPYRFIVPTALVDNLVDDSDAPSEDRHLTLVAMVTTLLGSKYSMIGLSTSDTANDLLGYAVRRVHHDAKDPVLVPLVRCIGALGTHVYYADQMNDLAEEITARIATLEMPQDTEIKSDGVVYTDSRAARESIRMLLACMLILMKTAQKSGGEVQRGVPNRSGGNPVVQKSGSRNRISTSVWHQTASLLASPDQSVRQSLQEALLAFFETEIEPASINPSQPIADSLGSKLSVEATGFAHSFSAAMYVLALSNALHAPSSMKDSPLEALPIIDRASKERKGTQDANASAAMPVDFSALIKLLNVMLERIPIASVLGIVPALLALDQASSKMTTGVRKEAIAALVQSGVNKIGEVCAVNLSSKPPKISFPPFPPQKGSQNEVFSDVDSKSSSKPALNATSVISTLASSAILQSATGLDAKTLQQWFGRDWSVQIAVDDSFIGASPYKLDGDERALRPEMSNGLKSSTLGRLTSPPTDLNAATSAGEMAGRPSMSVQEFRYALGTQDNGALEGANLDKRSSRRAVRKNDPNGQVQAGAASNNDRSNGVPAPISVSGLLDSMKVGLPEEEEEPKESVNGLSETERRVKAPYAP